MTFSACCQGAGLYTGKLSFFLIWYNFTVSLRRTFFICYVKHASDVLEFS